MKNASQIEVDRDRSSTLPSGRRSPRESMPAGGRNLHKRPLGELAPRSRARTARLAILLASLHALPGWAYNPLNRAEYLAKLEQAKALYKDKCDHVAGIRIYKTVPDVEGLLLMKVRPMRGDRELADPMWPGAAFGGEATSDGYITSFLGNESPTFGPIDPQHRGHIGTKSPPNPGSLPGYRWVEVIDNKDGQRYRYMGRYDEPWQQDKSYLKGYIRFSLDKIPSPSKSPPRYAVTFEDHVIPEERDLWIASSTVRVIDLQTNEVLGEMTRYAISHIHAPRQSPPWLNHYHCPGIPGPSGADTRLFVDQVLIPKREK